MNSLASQQQQQQQHRPPANDYHSPVFQQQRQEMAPMGLYHQQQQNQQQPHNNTYMQSKSNSNNNNNHHGKKSSLAMFDPFSSTAVVSASASPMRRDSSPTTGEYNMANNKQERQPSPVTPPSVGRPLVMQTNNNSNNVCGYERFDNENGVKENVKNSPKINNAKKRNSLKQVNKFLRKPAALVKKNFSPGHLKKTKRSSSSSPPPAAPMPRPSGNEMLSKIIFKDNAPVLSVAEKKNAQGEAATNSGSDDSPPPKTMAQDLLELKDQYGINLQIPSLLTKNAPTSFLRGDEAVAVTDCSNEPTPFQLEIPSLSEVVTIARLNEFVENYRKYDQNLDLRQFVGLNRMQLQQKVDSSANNTNTIKEHVTVVQSLLDCTEAGDEKEISIQGFLTETGDLPADSRAEAVIFQGQRNFTVVFRGTSEQQSKVLGNSKSKKRAVPLDSANSTTTAPVSSLENGNNKNNVCIDVYSGFLETYSKVEEECFRLLDKLVDENPFCDVVFSGFTFGAAMATLGAVRYAKTRPTMRVGCLTLASPKVGFSHFRQMVHSTPNLKVVRLELGSSWYEPRCQGPTVGGYHVGHTLVLNNNSQHQQPSTSSSGTSDGKGKSPTGRTSLSEKKEQPQQQQQEQRSTVSVYKFETPKLKNGGSKNFFKTSNPGLKKYISTLEDLASTNNKKSSTSPLSLSSSSWPKDFANNAGEGVVVNNEKRLVV